MSHKIKINFKDNKTLVKKNQEDQINKISINLGSVKKLPKEASFYESILNTQRSFEKIKENNISQKKTTDVISDKELYKLFKKNNFFRLDLHGQTLEGAKKLLTRYFQANSRNRNLLHIVITGLGNKPNQTEFFSGKIRNAFTLWIKEEPIRTLVHSYHPCKIQHGGLGAFYIKLRSIK